MARLLCGTRRGGGSHTERGWLPHGRRERPPAVLRCVLYNCARALPTLWPTGCSSIGSWSLVLELTSYAATITSALLFAFTGDFLANRKLFSRFLLFIAYECLLVAVKVAYQLLRDTPPFEVKLQRKRVNFLGRKIVADEPDERKEDSDDESEEDEARHPLIVHDRDPEQNLEALRNPDAYRQNLA